MLYLDIKEVQNGLQHPRQSKFDDGKPGVTSELESELYRNIAQRHGYSAY